MVGFRLGTVWVWRTADNTEYLTLMAPVRETAYNSSAVLRFSITVIHLFSLLSIHFGELCSDYLLISLLTHQTSDVTLS